MTLIIPDVPAWRREHPDFLAADVWQGLAAAPEVPTLLDDAAVEHLPPIAWLVEGMVPANVVCSLHGAPGTAKSFVALDAALSIATGQPFAGRATRRGPAVYVAAEGFAGVGARVAAWKHARGFVGPAGVHFLGDAVPLLDSHAVARFLDAIREYIDPAPALVVVDTLSRCLAGADENAAEAMTRAIGSADRIARETGATVLLVHHARKDGDVERGSSVLRGAMDSMWLAKREDNRVVVSCEKAKDAPAFAPVGFELVPVLDSCVLVTATEGFAVSGADLPPKAREVLSILQSCADEDGLSLSAWQRACGDMPARTFYSARTRLVALSYVQWIGTHRTKRYRVTDTGASVR